MHLNKVYYRAEIFKQIVFVFERLYLYLVFFKALYLYLKRWVAMTITKTTHIFSKESLKKAQ